jgi:hypothetical protein
MITLSPGACLREAASAKAGERIELALSRVEEVKEDGSTGSP